MTDPTQNDPCIPVEYDHKQVNTSRTGIMVDEGILPVIEALWAAGIETTYSCQGNDKFQARRTVTTDSDGHEVSTLTSYYYGEEITGNEPGELVRTGITDSYIAFPTYEDLSSAVRFFTELIDLQGYGYRFEPGERIPKEHWQFDFRVSLSPFISSIGFSNEAWSKFSTVLRKLEEREQ